MRQVPVMVIYQHLEVDCGVIESLSLPGVYTSSDIWVSCLALITLNGAPAYCTLCFSTYSTYMNGWRLSGLSSRENIANHWILSDVHGPHCSGIRVPSALTQFCSIQLTITATPSSPPESSDPTATPQSAPNSTASPPGPAPSYSP